VLRNTIRITNINHLSAQRNLPVALISLLIPVNTLLLLVCYIHLFVAATKAAYRVLCISDIFTTI
jgi:hypothetical protein